MKIKTKYMRKHVLLILLVFTSVAIFAQDEVEPIEGKTGWNFGALPTITFNTDLGFQYGALVDLYHYGDGTEYPNYLHNIYFEASRFTKGSAIYRVSYDSEYLIPGIRITSDLAYLPNEAYDFYGFNGYESKFNSDWQNSDAGDGIYKTRMFYKYQNRMFRFKTDVQIPISNNLLGLVGVNFQNIAVNSVDVDRFNKGKEDDPDALPTDAKTLYDEYIDWGIISEEEKDGGFIPLLKLGLVYDTRDNEPNPMKGMWTEAFVYGAPEFLGSESGFVKFNFTHRQYFTLIERDLSLACRLGYQGTIAGETPFYYQSQIESSQKSDIKGLGGAKTLRGVNLNRVVGDGFVYGNIELRWKAVHFKFINQNFYLGVNAYTDFGQTVQKITNDALLARISDPLYDDYFSKDGESLHVSYGGGLRIAMNQNFIIAIDYAQATNMQDGSGSGFYIGLNYLF